jgi:hypothetical protein
VDGVALIHRARDAGLRLEIAGSSLKITGPKEAEPLVRLLAENKTQVLEVLANNGLRGLRELRKIAQEGSRGALRQPADNVGRDRAEERAAILEFDEGLPRAEAEAIAHREMSADDTEQTECDPSPYALALAALRAKCPAYVPEDRWRQAIVDATTFVTEWGVQARVFGWTACELLGLHPVPKQPAANYARLSRLDNTGLIWLLRGRPVIALTATEAAIRCPSGATLKFYRRTEAPPAAEIVSTVGAEIARATA